MWSAYPPGRRLPRPRARRDGALGLTDQVGGWQTPPEVEWLPVARGEPSVAGVVVEWIACRSTCSATSDCENPPFQEDARRRSPATCRSGSGDLRLSCWVRSYEARQCRFGIPDSVNTTDDDNLDDLSGLARPLDVPRWLVSSTGSTRPSERTARDRLRGGYTDGAATARPSRATGWRATRSLPEGTPSFNSSRHRGPWPSERSPRPATRASYRLGRSPCGPFPVSISSFPISPRPFVALARLPRHAGPEGGVATGRP